MPAVSDKKKFPKQLFVHASYYHTARQNCTIQFLSHQTHQESQRTLPHTHRDIDGEREREKQQKHYITVCFTIQHREIKRGRERNEKYNCTISLMPHV